MEKKVFKTGEIITPEFMNQLQDAVKETESEVSEHYGEFEELVTALMRVFTSNFDTYSVSKDGFTATLDGKSLTIGNGQTSISLKPGNGGIAVSVNGGDGVSVNPLEGISFYGPGALGLKLERGKITITGAKQGSSFPVEINVNEGELNIDSPLAINQLLRVFGKKIVSFDKNHSISDPENFEIDHSGITLNAGPGQSGNRIFKIRNTATGFEMLCEEGSFNISSLMNLTSYFINGTYISGTSINGQNGNFSGNLEAGNISSTGDISGKSVAGTDSVEAHKHILNGNYASIVEKYGNSEYIIIRTYVANNTLTVEFPTSIVKLVHLEASGHLKVSGNAVFEGNILPTTSGIDLATNQTASSIPNKGVLTVVNTGTSIIGVDGAVCGRVTISIGEAKDFVKINGSWYARS